MDYDYIAIDILGSLSDFYDEEVKQSVEKIETFSLITTHKRVPFEAKIEISMITVCTLYLFFGYLDVIILYSQRSFKHITLSPGHV
jgi:hypothetical protein